MSARGRWTAIGTVAGAVIALMLTLPSQSRLVSSAVKSASPSELRSELRARESPERTPLLRRIRWRIRWFFSPLRRASAELLVKTLFLEHSVIYGKDRREEVDNPADPLLLRNADATAILVPERLITRLPDGSWMLVTRKYSTTTNFCPQEPFLSQPAVWNADPGIAAVCTAFLVDPCLAVTAGHCTVDPGTNPDARIVFGFRSRSGSFRTQFKSPDVSEVLRVIDRRYSATGSDWAVVELAARTSRAPVLLDFSPVRKGEGLYTIGYPKGLPQKYAPDAVVRKTLPGFFQANLDTYGGNSGSPVFSESTHRLRGLFVRGETDFVTATGCAQSLLCPDTGCRGQDCLYVGAFGSVIRNYKSGKYGQQCQ